MAALTKDMIAVPQLWRLSMEVRDGRVDLILNNTIEDHSLMRYTMQLDGSVSPLSAFEDFVYENPLLLSDFGKVDVLIDTPRFTIVPSEVGSDELREALARTLWPDPRLTIVANDLGASGETLLMAIDQGVAAFVRRTFLDTEIMHPVTALARYFWPQSQHGTAGKIYVNLHADHMQVLAMSRSRLRVACEYDFGSVADAAYYVLAAAQTAGLQLDTDELMLCGNQQMRQELTPRLREFAQYVMPVIFPSEIFRAGKEALQAPFELIVLPMCQ